MLLIGKRYPSGLAQDCVGGTTAEVSGFPTVDAETVLLLACHTFFFLFSFFQNLSPCVKRTEVVEMNLGPKWSADIL